MEPTPKKKEARNMLVFFIVGACVLVAVIIGGLAFSVLSSW